MQISLQWKQIRLRNSRPTNRWIVGYVRVRGRDSPGRTRPALSPCMSYVVSLNSTHVSNFPLCINCPILITSCKKYRVNLPKAIFYHTLWYQKRKEKKIDYSSVNQHSISSWREIRMYDLRMCVHTYNSWRLRTVRQARPLNNVYIKPS